MTACDTCAHSPVCNIKEEYRQLLVTLDPFTNRHPAFKVTASCKYDTNGHNLLTRKEGNSYFNGHDGV